MRTRSVFNLATLVVAVLGAADSVYLTIEHWYPRLADVCTTGGCGTLLDGPYGHFGPIPTAAFGLGMYLLLIALCVRRMKGLTALRHAEEESARAYATAGASEESSAQDEGVRADPERAAPPVDLTSPAQARALEMRAGLKRLDLIVFLIAASGFAISWWLQYVALFQEKAFCPF